MPRASAADEPAPAAAAAGDVLVLRDGRRLSGTVVADTPEAVTFRSGGSTRLYVRSDVDRIETVPAGEPTLPPTPAPGAPEAATGAPQTPGAPAAPGPASGGKGKKKDEFGRRGKVLTEAARAWVRDLAARASDEDELVRRSVAAGLRALGPAAAPTIRECAAAAATPSAREFLERVAGDLAPDGRGPGAGAPAAGETPTAPPPSAGDGNPNPAPSGGAAPAAPPGPGRRPAGRDGFRAASDRLLADLELRDDQKVPMAELLGSLERRQFELARQARQSGLTPEDLLPRVEEIRSSVLGRAKDILDGPQMDVFAEHAQRHFDGLLLRVGKGAAKPGAGAGTAPGEPPKE